MNARAEAVAAEMIMHGMIDRYDRQAVARMVAEAIELDRANRDEEDEEQRLP